MTEERRRLLGQTIYNMRKVRGVSQERLGELAGIDRAYMGRIERGETSVGVDKIWAICDALNITPAQLFGEAEQPETSEESPDDHQT